MKHSRALALFCATFAALIVLHWRLVSLPYFWDEAGYYIPAARDIFLTADLIPRSTLLTGHPPLLGLWLTVWWKLFAYSPVITRLAMLSLAAFALTQVYALSLALTRRSVAAWTTALTALYPVVFAQSSLAHADLAAFALTMWGLRNYFSSAPRRRTVLIFALAALAKEIALVTPFALALWELESVVRGKNLPRSLGRTLSFLVVPLPLAVWYGYHYSRTGHLFGDQSFLQYNVSGTLSPVRFVLAAWQRIWQVFGHMNMWLFSGEVGAAMLLQPKSDGAAKRNRISVAIQAPMFTVIGAHIIVHSLIGGAVLARYMLVCFPLVLLIGVNTLWRRVPGWHWLAGSIAAAFIAAWFLNPPYRFAPEDNLNYADYVRLHERGASYIAQHYPHARILTAWPASDELSRPWLGYVVQAVPVVRIENFTQEQMVLAQHSSDFDIVYAFSTKYEPSRLMRFRFWEHANTKYFDYHRDLRPEAIAQILGGKIAFISENSGQWVAVIEIPKDFNTRAVLDRLKSEPRRPAEDLHEHLFGKLSGIGVLQ